MAVLVFGAFYTVGLLSLQAKKHVMLSLSKHLYHESKSFLRGITAAVEMLRQAQHDVIIALRLLLARFLFSRHGFVVERAAVLGAQHHAGGVEHGRSGDGLNAGTFFVHQVGIAL